MRTLVLSLFCLLVAGCDSGSPFPGSFSASVSGAYTSTATGGARFERAIPGSSLSLCRNIEMSGGESRLSLSTACTASGDTLRVGAFAAAWRPSTDSTFFLSFYDDRTRRAYQSTGGLVEILAESDDRVTGRFDVEARRLLPTNRLDTLGVPLRIVGTFDAAGYVYTDG